MSLDPASSIAACQRRLVDLQTFQLPRLQTCTGPIGLLHELAEEMRADLATAQRSLEMSREVAESARDREMYLSRINEMEQQLDQIRIDYRKALVASKRAMASGARTKRHELLALRSESPGQTEDLPATTATSRKTKSTSEDDALQTKTNEVTDALRRTTTLMQAELEKSVLSVQMLDESTRSLHLTQTLYDNYTSLLGTSAQLVKAIERADWYDRLLIFAAFALFLLTVAWVIKRRVLDKVLGGVGWWFGGSWKLVSMGLGRSTATAIASTALAATSATGVKAAVHATQGSGASDHAVQKVKWTGENDPARIIPVSVESAAVMTTHEPSAAKIETTRDEL